MHHSRDELRCYLDGALPPVPEWEVRSHVESCPLCQSVCDQMLSDFGSEFVATSTAGSANSVTALLPEKIRQHAEALGNRLALPPSTHGRLRQTVEAVPQAIGRYRMLHELGQGGLSRVFAAIDPRTESVVAIKVLHQRHLSDRDACERFRRETKSASALPHTAFARVLDSDFAATPPYFVMEFVDGKTFAELVDQYGSLTVGEACELVYRVAVAMTPATHSGAIHRDLKPTNLMLDHQRQVWILDFGLVRWLKSQDPDLATMTASEQLLGTLEFIAPEQLANSHHVDQRADVFSLAATLYWLLTGDAPFSRRYYDSYADQIQAILHTAPIQTCRLRAAVPESLSDLIQRALSQRVEERPSTMEDFARLLEPYAGDDLLRLTLEPERARFIATWRKARQHVRLKWLLAVLIMLCLGWTLSTLPRGSGSPAVAGNEAPAEAGRSDGSPPSIASSTGTFSTATDGDSQNPDANPFGTDVPPESNPEALLKLEDYARNHLGVHTDQNASAWGSAVTTPNLQTIEGDWGSRWKCFDPQHKAFHQGTAELKRRGQTFWIRHQDLDGLTYIIRARRDGDYLYGQFLDLANPSGTSPWLGRIVDTERIDGVWLHPNGSLLRWDLRRRPADPFVVERRAAERVIALNGAVEGELAANRRWVLENGKLPEEFYWVDKVTFWYAPVRDEQLAPLGSLPRLNSLTLGYCRDITDQTLIQLRTVNTLRSLDVPGSQVGDNGLASLRNLLGLERLNVSETNVADQGLTVVGKMLNLREFEVNFRPITDTGLKALHALGQLERLHLYRTRITDAGLAEAVTRFPKLKNLRLGAYADDGSDGVTPAGLAALSALPELEEISIHGPLLTTELADVATRLPKLWSLHIDLHARPEQFQCLPRFHSVRQLKVWSIPIDDGVLDQIEKMPSLEQLQFWMTSIQRHHLNAFAQMPRLTELELYASKTEMEDLNEFRRRRPDIKVKLNFQDLSNTIQE